MGYRNPASEFTVEIDIRTSAPTSRRKVRDRTAELLEKLMTGNKLDDGVEVISAKVRRDVDSD